MLQTNKKNILFISSWYPNRNNNTHGIFNRFFAEAVSVYNNVYVIHAVSEDNCPKDFELVVSKQDLFEEVIVYFDKTKVNPISKIKRYKKAYQIALNYFLNKNIKFDFIHCNVALNAGIAAIEIKQQLKIPLVVNENWTGYLPEDGNYKGLWKKYFVKKIIKESDVISPVTKHLAKAMQGHGLKGNYQIVPNVCDVGLFRILKTETNQKLRFIHVSALVDEQKNVSALLKVFAKCVRENTNMELVIVGKGGDEEFLKDIVAGDESLNKAVSFVGRKVGEELVLEINKADCLLMFSHYENLPLVILESMACGKPVISSNVGGIAEVVEPFNGVLVDSKNEVQLQEAILSFDKIKYNANEIRNNIVNNYSNDVIGKKFDLIYRSILKHD